MEAGARGARTRRGRYGGSRSFKPPTNCGHCVYINRQLGANLDVHHSSQNCPRKQLSVNILETLEQENNEPSEDEYYEEGERSLSIPSCKISSLQNSDLPMERQDFNTPVVNNSLKNGNDNMNNKVSEVYISPGSRTCRRQEWLQLRASIYLA